MKKCNKCSGDGYYWSNDGEFGENRWKCDICKGSGQVSDDNTYVREIHLSPARPRHDWGKINLPPRVYS